MKPHILFFALLCAGAFVARAQDNPVKLATTARFDLRGDAGVGALNQGFLTSAHGDAVHQTWLAAPEVPNTYTVSFDITRYSWTRAVFRFVPAGSGTVTLSLLGPYELSPNGSIYRQAVLWDAISADRGAIENGSFEKLDGDLPAGWFSYGQGARVISRPAPPRDGERYAVVWHNSPFISKFAVTAGVPVTLTLFARAAVPNPYPDMARITTTNTPAHLAARHFRRGINLSGYLDAPPHTWGGSGFTTADFDHIRDEGFDHVRIPIGWNFYAGGAPDFALGPRIFAKVDFLVTNALAHGLAAIINIHNWDQFATNALSNPKEFDALWRQIAEHYAAFPPELAFELMNEPFGRGSSTEILNPIYAEAIRQIRMTNPNRTIFVGASHWNAISELGALRLPDDDSNIIVTVHCYDPFYFTHQGATWPGPQTATVGIVFPGPPATPVVPAAGIGPGASNWIANYNTYPADANPSSPLAFEAEMQDAQEWSQYYGRPIHVGEFGAYTTSDPASRARFLRAIRTTMERDGLGWAMWDWNSGFHYWDPQTGQPAPGLRDALFGAF